MANFSFVSRRKFLAGAGALAATSLPAARLALAASTGTTLTADQALHQLMEGNRRFAGGKLQSPRRTPADYRRLASGQNPIVAVLSCADSRVPPEVIFDQGLGDVFTVRIAGNYSAGSGSAVLGSLEYAVSQLNVPLVLVLGHSQCGAIKAAIEHVNDNSLPGELNSMVAPLKPAAREAKGTGDVKVSEAIRINVRNSVSALQTGGAILPERVKLGKLRVVGGIYDLATGTVTITA